MGSTDISNINKLRKPLSREIETNPSLSKDLDTTVFVLYDQLKASRKERRPPKPSATTEAEQSVT